MNFFVWTFIILTSYGVSVVYCFWILYKMQRIIARHTALKEQCPHPSMHLVILLLVQAFFFVPNYQELATDIPLVLLFLVCLLNYTTAQFSYGSIKHWGALTNN